jgi:hypothetical protein
LINHLKRLFRFRSFFPPKCTSLHQPLDEGIISTLKVTYKREMLMKLILAMDDLEAMQAAAAAGKKRPKRPEVRLPGDSSRCWRAGRKVFK